MRSFWLSDPTKILARELVITHLKKNTQLTILDQYNSWLDPNFQRYTSIYYPYIAFITDKQYSTLKNSPKGDILLLLEYHLLCQHTNCVYIDSVVENLMRLFCYIVIDAGLENHYEPLKSEVVTHLDISFNTLVRNTSHHGFNHNLIEIEKLLYKNYESSPPLDNQDIRDILVIPSLSFFLQSASNTDDNILTIFYVKVFIIHLAIIKHSNIQFRNCYLPGEIKASSDSTLTKLTEMHSKFSLLLLLMHHVTYGKVYQLDIDAPFGSLLHHLFTNQQSEKVDISLGKNHELISDLFDGRLITFISIYLLQIMKTNENLDRSSIGLGDEITDSITTLWNQLQNTLSDSPSEFYPIISPCTVSFHFDLVTMPDYLTIRNVEISQFNTRLVHRLSGNLKDEMQRNSYEGAIKFNKIDWKNKPFKNNPTVLFPLLGNMQSRLDTFKEDEELSKAKKLKRLQQYHKFMTFYSASLSGGLGWKEPIIVEKVTEKDLATRERQSEKKGKAEIIASKQPKRKVQSQSGSKGSASRRDAIIKQNMEKRFFEVDSKYREEWSRLKESLKSSLVSENHIKLLDAFIISCASKSYKLEAQLKKLQYLVIIYQEDKNKYISVSNILQLVNVIIEQHFEEDEKEFSTKARKWLVTSILELGFNLYANLVSQELSYDIYNIIDPSTNLTDEGIQGLTCIEFQLKYMGHLMPRDVGKQRDDRVSNFIPDEWQVKLLDAVDRRESAVIHAPTSSGKTFISYYNMLKALRANDEDLVIYVSPSKELMNQVAASNYAQFGHKTFKNLSMTLYGILAQGYEMKPFHNQILITLPEPFEYLLLSTDPECMKLVKRIKYVILDEVHCISAEEKSECWERILLLIQSPFLALSATIRNAQEFTKWLRGVQTRKFELKELGKLPSAATVHLISHEQRFSDLSKFRFDNKTNTLHHVHPWTCLKYEHLKASGYPEDLTLISDECLGAYEALRWVSREADEIAEEIIENIPRLDPNNFFADVREITKNDVRDFDKELSSLLLLLAQKGFQKEYQQIMERLLSEFSQEEILSLPLTSQKAGKLPNDSEMEKLKESHDLKFLRDLESSYKLPCIIFITDFYDVDKLATSLLEELEHLEEVKLSLRGEDRNFNKEKKVKELTRELDKLRKRLDTKLGEESREEVEAQIQGLLDELSAVPEEDEVDDDYTFANRGILSAGDKGKLLDNMRRKDNIPLFKRLLARGIMIHHEELTNKEKQFSEISYRCGYVKILISTSTLALGIHMPCKTVVFYKDSLFLTALQYRQMSGRAGRRGYDLIGNVIFHNIHTEKFNLLNTAPVGRLYGNHIWSTSTLLRLIILLREQETKENIGMALTLFHRPFISTLASNNHISEVIKYEVLFSDHFLMQEDYLDDNGVPTENAALLSYFSFAEPSNFFLVTLLRSTLLNKIAYGYNSSDSEKKKQIRETLMLILCHILSVQYIPPMKISSENILPDLPDDISKVLDEHNFRAFSLYRYHIQSMCSSLTSKKELKYSTKLPISNIDFLTERSVQDSPQNTLNDALNKSQISSHLLSPFIQNSGFTDSSVNSTSSLVTCIPPSIDIDISVLPISLFWSLNEAGIPKNNYIFKLFTYSEITLEEVLNTSGLTDPVLFRNLRFFSVAIKSIYYVTRSLLPLGNEFRAVMDHINQNFKTLMTKMYRGVRV